MYIKRRHPFIIFLVVILLFSVSSHSQSSSVGVIGDSLALGFESHPELSAGIFQAKSQLKVNAQHPVINSLGIKDLRLNAPVLLNATLREFSNDREWVVKHLLRGMSQRYLLTPQYAWPYLVSMALKIAPESVFIAADEGAKVDKFTRQVDRLLNHDEVLPNIIFVYFTTSDLCAQNMSQLTSSNDYGEAIIRGVKYMVRNGKIPEGGVKLYFPSYLNISQFLNKTSILEQKFVWYGETGTCRKLRNRSFQPSYPGSVEKLSVEAKVLSSVFPPNPSVMCRTLFGQDLLAQREVSFFSQFNSKKREGEIKQLKEKYLSKIANHVRNYRIKLEDAISKLRVWLASQKPQKKLVLRVVKETSNISFEGTDVAPDCFHLNLNGQAKIAHSILKSLSGKDNKNAM